MPANTPRRFRAVLERLPGNLGWTIARLPFDPAKAWKKMVRQRVIVEIGGESFRTSLFSDSTPGPHRSGSFVLINKKMQKAAGASLGGMIDLTVAPDLDERTPTMPAELARLLKNHKTVIQWVEKNLSDSARLEIGKWIDGVKSPESRQRRAEQMAERLMLAMEGEKVLPPILEIAFRNSPVARKGWDAMSPAQRRNNLMAIFYYQTPEGKKNRVNKLVEDCLKVAKR